MGDVKRMVGAVGLRSEENEVMSQLIMPRHVLNPEKGLNYSYLKNVGSKTRLDKINIYVSPN